MYLAGAFGNYVDCRNARILGILPPVAEHVIRPVRNAAGLGVCESFYDPEVRAELGKISSLCQTLNLAEEPDFQERFMERLAFSALEV